MITRVWNALRRVFLGATAIAPSTERRASLDHACGGTSLGATVEQFLRHVQTAGTRFPFRPSLVGKTLGQYRITRRIGVGGMGTVYAARHIRLDREVALKVLPPLLAKDPDSREHLLQEARAASALDDPHIVTIHDIGCDHGTDFIVMEYVRGEGLDRIIPRRGLALNRAMSYAQQIAAGLAAAHRAGIVHHDLKPSNIRVTPLGGVKLLDFGLARRASRSSGRFPAPPKEKIFGTPGYVSPERVRREPSDLRSDVFVFGIVFYEMLTGRRPFRGRCPEEISASILLGSLPPLPRRIPGDVAAIVKRCLEKSPCARFQTMESISAALRAADAARETLEPRPLNRSRTLALANVVVLLLAVTGNMTMKQPQPGARRRVLVAMLAGRPGDRSVTQALVQSLREATRSCRDVEIALMKRPLPSDAREVALLEEARRRGASLLIWGDTDRSATGIEVRWRLGIAEETPGIPFRHRVALLRMAPTSFDLAGIGKGMGRRIAHLALLMSGMDHYRAHQMELAHRLLDEAIAEPPAPEELVDPGVIRYYRGLTDEALIDAGSCFKVSYHCDLSDATNSLTQEIQDFDAVLAARPEHADSLWHRGLAYSKLGALQIRSSRGAAAMSSWTHALADFDHAMQGHRTEAGFVGTLSDPVDVLWNRGLTHLQEARSGVLSPPRQAAELANALGDFDRILASESATSAFLQQRRDQLVQTRGEAEKERMELLTRGESDATPIAAAPRSGGVVSLTQRTLDQ